MENKHFNYGKILFYFLWTLYESSLSFDSLSQISNEA
jgi:hypothetical protein